MEEYHFMLNILLHTFKEAQKSPIIWNFHVDDVPNVTVCLKIPVLFIIGDTEGHDKLCGRFSSRRNPPRLCRCCTVPFKDTDDPHANYRYQKCLPIQRLVENGCEKELKSMSFHCVKNVWSDVKFCDSQRGIYGATLAELLHCLQQGIFEYGIKALYSQKKFKKRSKRKKENRKQSGKKIKFSCADDVRKNPEIQQNSDDVEDEDDSSDDGEIKSESEDESIDSDDEDEISRFSMNDQNEDEEDSIESEDENGSRLKENSIEYSSHFVFPKDYCNNFDTLCRKYGRYLQHQSDRLLPRIYFNSSYISIAKKNAHEMAGILLVYLMIFSSKEGENKLISSLGDQRLADFTHCFELLLLMENFCKQTSLHKSDLMTMKKGIPLIMDFIKCTLNRQDGNGMKIIKFHLMLHFVDDIRRFGSMRNYDSCIGERHHCTEVKDPAQQTQRRKNNFEKQTAFRYYENLLISIGENDMSKKKEAPIIQDQYKNNNILYDHRYKQLYKKDIFKKLQPCCWKDVIFQQSLLQLCENLVANGKVTSPIHFFTQHNREELIFRACPNYDDNGPWYDWGYVDWGDGVSVPAKMLIFIDLNDNFLEPFQVGSSLVSEPGYYAMAYTCNNENNPLKTMDTLLIEYNQLIMEDEIAPRPQLCMFSVESIVSTCVAVPFDPIDTIINAEAWCFLKPKSCWHEELLKHLRKSLK